MDIDHDGSVLRAMCLMIEGMSRGTMDNVFVMEF